MCAVAPLFFVAGRFESFCIKKPAECGGPILSYFLASIAVLVGWERTSWDDSDPFEPSDHIFRPTTHLFN